MVRTLSRRCELSDVPVFHTGAARLAEGLLKNTRLKALFLDCDLCKGIEDSGAAALAKALQVGATRTRGNAAPRADVDDPFQHS